MTWIYYRSILKLVTHPLPSSYTYPPITIQMNLFKYLFFPFLILLFLTHIKKILWSSLCDPYLHDYIYDQKSPPSTSNIPWPPHQYYTNPDFLTKNPARSLFYISTVHPPTKQHTRLPRIISNIPSITLHTFTSHLIKIHHNSQTFIRETYLHCTKCAWVKIDLTPSPRQHMEIQGGGDCDPEWRIKVPEHPPFLNQQKNYHEVFTLPTKKYCSSKNCTQFDTLPSDTLHNILTWNLSLVHHEKIRIVMVQLM